MAAAIDMKRAVMRNMTMLAVAAAVVLSAAGIGRGSRPTRACPS